MIAHIRKSGMAKEEQSVLEHLINVSEYAGIYGRKIGMESCAYLAGYIHDFGKLCNAFEHYICYSFEHPDKNTKGPDHSTAGAVWIMGLINPESSSMERMTAQIIALAVMGHHGGLVDIYDPLGESPYLKRLDKANNDIEWLEIYKEVITNVKANVDIENLKSIFQSAVKEINNIYMKLLNLNNSKKYLNYACGVLCKLLYSCLIDADRYDTATFMDGQRMKMPQGNYELWCEFSNRLEERILKFTDKPDINKLRKEISDSCFKNSNMETGIYKLNCPTGSGKTFSSLRYALNHAKKFHKERIFYIIPFISITDQNATEIKKILSNKEDDNLLDNTVLELHSGKETDENIDEYELKKAELVAERMDAPIILTTMVRFLNTFFTDGTRNIRAAHNFANSIIIFDEIQTLEPKFMGMFNGLVNFLFKVCNTTVVLSTATQPLLDATPDSVEALMINNDIELSGCTKEMIGLFKRTEFIDKTETVGNSKEFLSRLVWETALNEGNALVVLNTKTTVKILYEEIIECYGERIENEGFSLYVLTTNICPDHRKKRISEIKAKLKCKEKIIVISTQLIEAGVDISFNCVFRALAGLDKLIQSAGRCNRHGENCSGNYGKIYLINPEFEQLASLQDIKRGKKATERILSLYTRNKEQFNGDLGSISAIEAYFKTYNSEQKDNLTYRFKFNGNRELYMYELLDSNSTLKNEALSNMGIRYNRVDRPVLSQSFKTAAKNFSAIDEYGKSIIVPYGDGKLIINELLSARKNTEIIRLLKKAQQFTINIDPCTGKKLEGALIYYENLEIYILKDGYYDDNYGLSTKFVSSELYSF